MNAREDDPVDLTEANEAELAEYVGKLVRTTGMSTADVIKALEALSPLVEAARRQERERIAAEIEAVLIREHGNSYDLGFNAGLVEGARIARGDQ